MPVSAYTPAIVPRCRPVAETGERVTPSAFVPGRVKPISSGVLLAPADPSPMEIGDYPFMGMG